MRVTAETEAHKVIAIQHTDVMEQNYSSYIKALINGSKIYKNSFKFTVDTKSEYDTVIEVSDIDVMSCARNELSNTDKVALLNFASYKNPGGYFIGGALTQEESICHETVLYNVLKEFDDSYYSYNRSVLNRGLYQNKAIYSRDVLVHDKTKWELPIGTVDVITCAAPNVKRGLQYGNISQFEADECINERIRFILDIAVEEAVDTLILGAFGCGVFGNDPSFVAKSFYNHLNGKYKNKFKKVIFAIPCFGDITNYSMFELRFGEKLK